MVIKTIKRKLESKKMTKNVSLVLSGGGARGIAHIGVIEELEKQGLVRGDRVFIKMKEFIPDMNIEDLKINYAATSTDLIKKREVVFTSGSMFDAVRASVSIPTVFTPVETENSLLIDGGVINNVPISHVK